MPLETDHRERRQAQQKGMRFSLPRDRLGGKAAHIADVAAAVGLRITIEDFLVEAIAIDTDPIASRGTGVAFTTKTRMSPARDLRLKAMTELSLSWKSIHSNPS